MQPLISETLESDPAVKAKRSALKSVRAKKRQADAMKLRVAGATLEQIREQCGYKSASGAHYAIMAGLRDTMRPPAEELRTLQHQRLERLLFAVFPRAINGDLEAVDKSRALIGDIRKLFGLDAPTRIAGADGGPVQIQLTEVAAQVEAKLDELASRRAARVAEQA